MSSDNVILRGPVESDLPSLLAIRSDIALSEAILGRVFPIDEVSFREWVFSHNQGPWPSQLGWAIEIEGVVVGLCRIQNLHWINRTGWFGIWIGASHQGLGTGLKSVKAVLEYAHETLRLRQLRLEVLDSNLPAIRIYEKCGFVQEARMNEAASFNGHWADIVIMRADLRV